MKNLSINFIPANIDSYLESLKDFSDFKLLSDNNLSRQIINSSPQKIDTHSDNYVITDTDPEILCNKLLELVSIEQGRVIAPITDKYFKNNPLFLISIPKSGTHLLYELVNQIGYEFGGICSNPLHDGHWYFVESSHTHTSAVHFFNETLYKSPFGNRDHPFIESPGIFIYRNPLDILTSESNYYHKSGKTAFYRYLNGLSQSERLLKLIDDPFLLGSARSRIGDYAAWLDFSNVINVSFEELIGSKGGGNKQTQQRLIWSILLKLQAPGDPAVIGDNIFNRQSNTFYKGSINAYKESFSKEHINRFLKLPQDFMEKFGYSLEQTSPFSLHCNKFLSQPLSFGEPQVFPERLIIQRYLGFNIVRYKNAYCGIPEGLENPDLDASNEDIALQGIVRSVSLKHVKARIHGYFNRHDRRPM